MIPATYIQPKATRATTDVQVIRLWLHGKSAQTIRAYSKDVREFFRFVGCTLAQVRLEDVQGFADELDELATSSQARRLAAVKSLLSFANKIGYIPFNAGAPVELPKPENKLSERILSESAVQSIIHAATS
jgi:integrase/recombinase XerD